MCCGPITERTFRDCSGERRAACSGPDHRDHHRLRLHAGGHHIPREVRSPALGRPGVGVVPDRIHPRADRPCSLPDRARNLEAAGDAGRVLPPTGVSPAPHLCTGVVAADGDATAAASAAGRPAALPVLRPGGPAASSNGAAVLPAAAAERGAPVLSRPGCYAPCVPNREGRTMVAHSPGGGANDRGRSSKQHESNRDHD
jgi:hypothetical protein